MSQEVIYEEKQEFSFRHTQVLTNSKTFRWKWWTMVGQTGTRQTRPNQHTGTIELQRGWKDSNGRKREEREKTVDN